MLEKSYIALSIIMLTIVSLGYAYYISRNISDKTLRLKQYLKWLIPVFLWLIYIGVLSYKEVLFVVDFPPRFPLLLLLPLIGLIIMSIGLKKNFRALYLLKYGILSQGKTINIKPVISLEGGGGRAYNFVFEFKVKDKTYEASCITKEKERVEDDELYNILYDKRNPNRNIVYDALGHVPEIGQLGKIKQENPSSVFYLGIIFISLMINIYLYWSWYW